MAGPLLLDTHVWVWVMEGSRREIRPSIRNRIRKAVTDAAVIVSIMSVWEIAMLDAKARLQLSVDCRTWVERALTAPGIRLQALTPAIAFESCHLPGMIHGDPVDRILIATARLTGATLITRDNRILEYSASGNLECLET